MTTHPILFSTPMVQAILDGRKSMTRRTSCLNEINENPNEWIFIGMHHGKALFDASGMIGDHNDIESPFGKPGDILWVKETFYAYGQWVENGFSKTGKHKFKFQDLTGTDFQYKYEDDKPLRILKGKDNGIGWYKRPSIFMPKAAARIFLKITDIRVERLQNITEEDAIHEGLSGENKKWLNYYRTPSAANCISNFSNAKDSFQSLWNLINGTDSWHANPWVWVISFERCEKAKKF